MYFCPQITTSRAKKSRAKGVAAAAATVPAHALTVPPGDTTLFAKAPTPAAITLKACLPVLLLFCFLRCC